MTLSAVALIRITVILLYGSAGIVAGRWLIPRMSALAGRVASAYFVTQALVLGVALTVEPSNEFGKWLWNLDAERNIPATLAAIQLAMTGCVAILTTWGDAANLSRSHRIYLIALGWLFLHLARDEYYGFHEFRPDVRLQYAIAGAAVVLITLLRGWRSAGAQRVWSLLFVSGLAISTFGAYVLEDLRSLCIKLPGVDGCIWAFHYEETFEYFGIWLTLVALLGQFPHAPTKFTRLALLLFAPAFALSLFAPFALNYVQYRHVATPTEIRYAEDVALQAYRLEAKASSLEVQIFMSAPSWHAFTKLGYSVHLVDQVTGNSLSGTDAAESRRHDWRIALYDRSTRYSQWLSVDTSSIPVNRALYAVLTVWREQSGDFVRLKTRSSELQTFGDTQVVLGEFVLPAETQAAPSVSPLASFVNGYALEAVAIPERANAGETLDVAFFWTADEDGSEDLIQFLHLVQSNHGATRAYDQMPLGARLPTRLWYAGMSDKEVWKLTLAPDMAPGSYAVFTGLYSASDLTRVPAVDSAGAPWTDNRVALGDLIVE